MIFLWYKNVNPNQQPVVTYFIDITSPYISKWFFEHIIVTWLTYTARILIMLYFALAPFGHFYFFGVLKRLRKDKSLKVLEDVQKDNFSTC